MKKSFPLLYRFVVVLVLPLALVGLSAWLYLRQSLPDVSGTLHIDGVTAPVQIRRDGRGVPAITAGTDRDVFFAMGFVHAQDRMWQLEVQRRIAQGRLSELFGKDSVSQDMLLRSLGLYGAARTAWDGLAPDARASLQAYTDGINAWLARGQGLPPEFAAFDIVPARWTVYDSLAWLKIFSLNLSRNMTAEIARYHAAQLLSAPEMAVFFGHEGVTPAPLASGRPDVATALTKLGALYGSLEDTAGLGGKYVGSNAWAVSGALTADGGAMLANDPHLGLQIPSVWYPVVQRGEKLDSAGMSLVGLPLVIFGRNAHIAWGGTNMMADVQDLYFEQGDPKNPAVYRERDAWLPFATRTESIQVRAAFPAFLRPRPKPVEFVVRTSRRGPLVSDVIGMTGQPVALRWTALDPRDDTYTSFLRLNYARDWPSFRAALREYASPALNLLYADRQGNIGFQAIGKIPLRARGDGSLPSAGADGLHAWTGYIPFDELPSAYNPPGGYLVSANNKNSGADYPHFISLDWAPAGRADRIAALIEARKAAGGGFAPADFQRMQADVTSLPARAMLQRLRALQPGSARQREALEYLRHWDGAMLPSSQAATIFNFWMTHFKHSLFEERLHLNWRERTDAGYVDALVDQVSIGDLDALLGSAADTWCRHGQDTAPRACNTLLLRSLDEALAELTRHAGGDMDAWTWGRLQQARYAHLPFSKVRGLDHLFEQRSGGGGSPDTINVASGRFVVSEGYVQTFGASFRQIMQMGGSHPQHLYMNSTGQSGNVLSEHYADMVGAFAGAQLEALPGAGVPATQVLTPPVTAATSRNSP